MKKGLLRSLAIASIALLSLGNDEGGVDSRHVDRDIRRAYREVLGVNLRPQELDALKTASVNADGTINSRALFDRVFANPLFVEGRLATFVSRLTNEENEPFEEADDYQVALMLAITSDLDFRAPLKSPFQIIKRGGPNVALNPNGQYEIGVSFLSWNEVVEKLQLSFNTGAQAPRPDVGVYSDGLLTTQGFGKRFIDGGTNRRPVRGAFGILLCSKIETWKDATLDPFYIGRDIDRNPGGNPQTFQQSCRGCHAPMDGLRGSFARYDSAPGTKNIVFGAQVAKKYNQNATVFPDGYETTGEDWENLLVTPIHQARYGWRGKTSGQGLLEFAEMIADSQQFQSCMTQKLIALICDKNEADIRKVVDAEIFNQLRDSFRTDGYKIKTLIEKIVMSNVCAK